MKTRQHRRPAETRGQSVAATSFLEDIVNPIRIVAILIGSLLFLWLCAFNVAAQGVFGTISGTVSDPSGAVVPGATVKVINTGTAVTVALKANGAGVYNATSL